MDAFGLLTNYCRRETRTTSICHASCIVLALASPVLMLPNPFPPYPSASHLIPYVLSPSCNSAIHLANPPAHTRHRLIFLSDPKLSKQLPSSLSPVFLTSTRSPALAKGRRPPSPHRYPLSSQPQPQPPTLLSNFIRPIPCCNHPLRCCIIFCWLLVVVGAGYCYSLSFLH